jgi:uncharacterized membrane protein
MRLDRRIGALLLLIGGVMDLARLIIFTGFVSVASAEAATIAVNVIPSAIISVGLVATGFSYWGRGRVALIVAGLLGLAVVVVNSVQVAAHSPFGPAPSALAYLISFAAVIVAAVLLLSDRTQRGSARWAIAIPAGCIVLFFVSLFTLPVTWFYFLPEIGYAIAGALLIRPGSVPFAGTTER